MKHIYNLNTLDNSDKIRRDLLKLKGINEVIIKNKEKQVVVISNRKDIDLLVKEVLDYYDQTVIENTNNINEVIIKDELLYYGRIMGVFLSLVLLVLPIDNKLISLVYWLIAYFLVSNNILMKAYQKIMKKDFFAEEVLISIASIGALLINNYIEAIIVIVFYQLANFLQLKAMFHSEKIVSDLIDVNLELVKVIDNDKIIEKKLEMVNVNDIIVIEKDEKILFDGIVVEGNSLVNTFSISGESIPRKIKVNDRVLSGMINQLNKIKVKTTKLFNESTVAMMVDLVKEAKDKKAEKEYSVVKFAKIYSYIMMGLASLIIIMGVIFDNIFIYRGLIFIVGSSLYALVFSTSLAYFVGLSKSSDQGILIKSSKHLEKLNEIEMFVFDKTGTLTEGVFVVSNIHSLIDEKEFLDYFNLAEQNSFHPIAIAIRNYINKPIEKNRIKEYEELIGKGISCIIDNKKVFIGNKKIFNMARIEDNYSKEVEKKVILGSIAYLVVDQKYCGYIVISDKVRADAKTLIDYLQNNRKKVMMLSGDINENVSKVAYYLNIKDYKAELLPQQKLEQIEKINYKKAFIGDGINDALVIANSDIGISMGGLGSKETIDVSDIVLLDDSVSKIITSLEIAKKTKNIITQNTILSLIIKITILLFAIFGYATILAVIIADLIVTILATLNSLRLLQKR